MPENKKRRVSDRTNHRIVDLRECVPIHHDIFNHLESKHCREVESDKDSSHEHHDLIVGKDDRGII
jgi:hypothetical protein